MLKFLIIQTAFIGDVILATPIIEKLKKHYPESNIDFLLRKGNESLLLNHPKLRKLWVWDKKKGKYGNLFKLILQFRKEKYDWIINLQRFTSTGIVTISSGAKQTTGFDKNPLSNFFTHKKPHYIENGKHEVERNLSLIEHLTDSGITKPVLYPSATDFENVVKFKATPFVCIAPTSVWFTKQYPSDKWLELISLLPSHYSIYLLGGPDDKEVCDVICKNATREITNLAGKLSLLASAALMKDAAMNYVNDSSPLHLASAMNAATCAVYCSTIPQFGFGPLSDRRYVIEIEKPLGCRPCGLHGRKACPEGHFKCAREIKVDQFDVTYDK